MFGPFWGGTTIIYRRNFGPWGPWGPWGPVRRFGPPFGIPPYRRFWW